MTQLYDGKVENDGQQFKKKITTRVNPNPKNESPNRIKVLQHA